MKFFPRQALALLGCACLVSTAAMSAEPDQAPPPGHMSHMSHMSHMMQGHGEQGRGMDGHGPDQHRMGEHGPEGHDQGAPFLHGVKLDEAQQDKVFAILHAQAPMLREQGKAARQAHEALRAMGASVPFDEAKAAALAQSGAKAMAAMALQHARTEAQIYALLTPEQRRLAAEHAARRGPHPEGGPEGHPAPRP